MSTCIGMQGRTYLCKRLDLDERLAVVRPANLKYYTRPRDFTDIFVVGGHRAAYPAEVPSQEHERSCLELLAWIA